MIMSAIIRNPHILTTVHLPVLISPLLGVRTIHQRTGIGCHGSGRTQGTHSEL